MSDVSSYAASVRAALADLAPERSEELLEDLESHLEEVAAETGGPLADRLGPPDVYAAELRASAGVPPGGGTRVRAGIRRRVRAGLRRQAERVGTAVRGTPGGAAVLAFLPELRPGWWVLRGWLAVVLLMVWTFGDFGPLLLPRVRGNLALGLLLTVAAVLCSVWLGRRTDWLRPGLRQAVVTGNVLLALTVLLAGGGSGRGGEVVYAGGYQPATAQVAVGELSNVYAYDAEGRPLADVQLFDQDGRPLTDLLQQAPDGRPAQAPARFGVDGLPRTNVYPRSYRAEDYRPDGGPTTTPVAAPSVEVGALAPTAPATGRPPTATASPTVTASPNPTARRSSTPSATARRSSTPSATDSPQRR